MNFLTVAQVLFIHARLIRETGGEPGVRDLGLLAAAVVRPQATFDGKDLYPSLFDKTAALLESLVRNHPFVAAISASGSLQRVYSCIATATDSNRPRLS